MNWKKELKQAHFLIHLLPASAFYKCNNEDKSYSAKK